jgi:hypothetical protein
VGCRAGEGQGCGEGAGGVVEKGRNPMTCADSHYTTSMSFTLIFHAALTR